MKEEEEGKKKQSQKSKTRSRAWKDAKNLVFFFLAAFSNLCDLKQTIKKGLNI
jgi:hypothetical protein